MISILKRTSSVVLLLIFFTMIASCGKNYTYEELKEIQAEIYTDMRTLERPGIASSYTKDGRLIVNVHQDCTYLDELKKEYRKKYGGAVKIEVVEEYDTHLLG